jgi:NAD+ kinase
MSAPRVLVIYKRTTFQRFRGGQEHAHSGPPRPGATAAWPRCSRRTRRTWPTLERTKEVLKHLGVDARFRHSYTPEPDDAWDLVVTLGGDGTLLWASHLVGPETPMLAINSAPRTSVGYFLRG